MRDDDETRNQTQYEYSTEMEESLITSFDMVAAVENDLTGEMVFLASIVVGGVVVGTYYVVAPLASATSVATVLSSTATQAVIEAVKLLIAEGVVWISQLSNSGAVPAFS